MSDVNATLPEVPITAKKFVPTPGPPVPPTPQQDVAGQTAPAGPINDPTGPQTAVRQPLVRVLANGLPLAGVISAEVQQNNFYQSDRFTLNFAATASPPGWWDVEPPWKLDTQFSLNNGGSWTSLLIGEVDHLTMNMQTGTLVVEGRDLSALLIETKTQVAYFNQTSSQIAETIAASHGLKTNIQPTTQKVGRYYEDDHVRGSLDQFAKTTTEWDLLVYLAQIEGFDIFVKGETLNFIPLAPENSIPFAIQWTPPGPVPRLNTTTLRMERSLTLAKDIEVWVRSWSSQQGRGFTKKSRASGTRTASAVGTTPSGKTTNTTQRYVFVFPNLSESEAQIRANQIALDLTKHERVIDVDMPGDLTLDARMLVKLGGTGTSFDQLYHIDHITRSISFSEGFRQTVRMKNSSPRSQVQLG